jgi:hypothetical protein
MDRYKFLMKCIDIIACETDLRSGQVVFNEMYKLNPDIANKYRSSIIDPFYDDSNIQLFIETCFNDIERI